MLSPAGKDAQKAVDEEGVGDEPVDFELAGAVPRGFAEGGARHALAQNAGGEAGKGTTTDLSQRFEQPGGTPDRDVGNTDDPLVNDEPPEVEAEGERRPEVVRDDGDGAAHLLESVALLGVAGDVGTHQIGQLARERLRFRARSDVYHGAHSPPRVTATAAVSQDLAPEARACKKSRPMRRAASWTFGAACAFWAAPCVAQSPAVSTPPAPEAAPAPPPSAPPSSAPPSSAPPLGPAGTAPPPAPVPSESPAPAPSQGEVSPTRAVPPAPPPRDLALDAFVHLAIDRGGAWLEGRSRLDGGPWQRLCAAPCDRSIRVEGREFRVVAPGMTDSNVFAIGPGEGTARFQVRPGSATARTLGIAGLAGGLSVAFAVMALFGVGSLEDESGIKTAGTVTLAVGAVSVAAALPLLLLGATSVKDEERRTIAGAPFFFRF